MGLFNKLKNMLVDDVVEESDEQELDLNIDADLKKDELNGDYLSGKKQKVEEKEEKKVEKPSAVVVEEKKEEKIKEEKSKPDMHLISVSNKPKTTTTKTSTSRDKAKIQRGDVYVIPPVVSPMFGRQVDEQVIKPTKKVVKHEEEDKSDPLITLISPIYGKRRIKEENEEEKEEVKEENVVKEVELDKPIIHEKPSEINEDSDYIETNDEENDYEDTSETIGLKDLLGDSKVDDTQQISLFNDDTNDSDTGKKE